MLGSSAPCKEFSVFVSKSISVSRSTIGVARGELVHECAQSSEIKSDDTQ
jgi:hypothetical protein